MAADSANHPQGGRSEAHAWPSPSWGERKGSAEDAGWRQIVNSVPSASSLAGPSQGNDKSSCTLHGAMGSLYGKQVLREGDKERSNYVHPQGMKSDNASIAQQLRSAGLNASYIQHKLRHRFLDQSSFLLQISRASVEALRKSVRVYRGLETGSETMSREDCIIHIVNCRVQGDKKNPPN